MKIFQLMHFISVWKFGESDPNGNKQSRFHSSYFIPKAFSSQIESNASYLNESIEAKLTIYLMFYFLLIFLSDVFLVSHEFIAIAYQIQPNNIDFTQTDFFLFNFQFLLVFYDFDFFSFFTIFIEIKFQ